MVYINVEFVCNKCGYKFFSAIDKDTPIIKVGGHGKDDSKKEMIFIDCENPKIKCTGKAIGYC